MARPSSSKSKQGTKSAGTPESGESGGNRDKRKALVERELMEKACILFAEKGYAGTSLTDIADSVGLTRGAIYYYFKNKEALLEALVQEVALMPLKEISEWKLTATGKPSERLKSFVRMRIMAVLQRGIQMRMIEVTEAALPPDLLRRHTEAKRNILSEYRAIIREGILAGEFRPVNDRYAAFGVIGIVNWTNYWFDEDRGASAEDVAEELAELAVQSLLTDESRRGRLNDPNQAIEVIQENLRHLSKLIRGEEKA
ncbi:TetR/AcrR family transcriptional regulator [Chelatococcus asaccharovorans]|uniref:TetR family transcriptional regulator n=1 Tax=Chelatococcus asaccharovorans TaxID=28210 RepID=A0A2V3TWW1_9HYPH|nr:TetR family transcriptional regulator [Chelatococcus asaccharovorans]MBS7705170.1 TetR family transcriptional regulator [Chelatococcus asaccharovorans]PXW53667.1 TetR family transcriptional regulator [Chelatococcus asaccharovorans]CAH1653294.1 TetR family transcriptional regulator [Chelatococcus asaccharovorans]CAH1686087.1 TetR family transcriptional regulator [Chelatococcus asaccharovorans]